MRAIRNLSIPSRGRQRGAVLYVALIMLVLLALIGVIGAQVSGMQERMSSNYLSTNMAFQRAEAVARSNEKCIESLVNRVPTACTVQVDQFCDDPNAPDAVTWASNRKMDDKELARVRSVGKCILGNNSLGVGKKPESEDATPVYQITAYSADRDDNPTSSAAIDTSFRP